MKETADAYLSNKVTHIIVTDSAYLNDAGIIAGRNVLRIADESTAGSIAHGLGEKGGESQIIVYDLGGGTFDVSLRSIDDGIFEVFATADDTQEINFDLFRKTLKPTVRVFEDTNEEGGIYDVSLLLLMPRIRMACLILLLH
jgi:molecular chaperone DnaK (HSP70)